MYVPYPTLPYLCHHRPLLITSASAPPHYTALVGLPFPLPRAKPQLCSSAALQLPPKVTAGIGVVGATSGVPTTSPTTPHKLSRLFQGGGSSSRQERRASSSDVGAHIALGGSGQIFRGCRCFKLVALSHTHTSTPTPTPGPKPNPNPNPNPNPTPDPTPNQVRRGPRGQRATGHRAPRPPAQPNPNPNPTFQRGGHGRPHSALVF